MNSIIPDANTLTVFPALLSSWPVAALMLRLAAGYFMAEAGYRLALRPGSHAASDKITGWLKLTVAALLILGLYTQVAVLTGIALILFTLSKKMASLETRKFNILLLIVLASLLILGPGWWAFDLPL